MNSVSHKPATLALIAFLAFVSTSCLVVSKHPLIDPLKFKPDARLSGRWMGTDKLADVYALFDGRASLETNILDKDGDQSERIFEIATGKLGKYHYMSIIPKGGGEKDGYLLARYIINGNEMNIWLLDSPLIDRAISEGKLKNDKGGSSMTMLTDSPKAIVEFLVAHEDEPELMEFLGTFKKVNR